MRDPAPEVVQNSGKVLNRCLDLQISLPMKGEEGLTAGQGVDGLIIACSVCSGNYNILIASLKKQNTSFL